MSGKKQNTTVAKVESSIMIPVMPVVRFNGDSDKNIPARWIVLDSHLNDEWYKKHIVLDGFESFEEAAVANLKAQIGEVIKNRHDWSRRVSESYIEKSVNNTTIKLTTRTIPVISIAQFLKENPDFEAMHTANPDGFRMMLETLKPDHVIVD